MTRSFCYIVGLLLASAGMAGTVHAQEGTDDPARLTARIGSLPWHNEQRALHYRPEGEDFVCVHGRHRFNRALYGTNTAFRVEAGDLPEFALYMPGMGGNWKFGISLEGTSKWLGSAEQIKAVYRPGSMIYEVRDTLLGKGMLSVRVLALADAEGMVIELRGTGVDPRTRLFCAFGGVSGKKFSRDGDLGADPESSFDCKPEYCKDNRYTIDGNEFRLDYGESKTLKGIFPNGAQCRLVDAEAQTSPFGLWNSGSKGAPALHMLEAQFDHVGKSGSPLYFVVYNPGSMAMPADPAVLFARAEKAREELAGRVSIHTPDPYINTLGGALAIAGDAIWESPSYLHGAVAWRMRLPGWRGPYVADPLGWHDRARSHFSSYALSQVLSPETGAVVADTNLHLARQLEKLGTSLFSEGYICRNPGGDLRPNHYDMNLVYIDELLDHLYWTGDTNYVRKMWPVLQRHLAWERRNFDVDGDGLYDAYCCIWASDALQYSGGGVTHSSAYNYRANRVAAELAVLIGEDPGLYHREAEKILHAVNTKLWMPSKGWYAEYIDRLAQVHPSAGLWTIYHSIDSGVPDPFQAWQSLRYIDTDIPHIPVEAMELKDKTLYTLSTTNWQPYTWSINNVVLAECLHTALACWQGGRPEQAWPIWKGALIESMYLGGSPGNFQQLSFYDAARGELYRDFADPIGMAARSLVEGLFGIHPDALHDTLTIRPGWPLEWKEASLHIPDIRLDYRRTGNRDEYTIDPSFAHRMNLVLEIRAEPGSIPGVSMNGRPVSWTQIAESIGQPMIRLALPSANKPFVIAIDWKKGGTTQEGMKNGTRVDTVAAGEVWKTSWEHATIESVYDPEQALDSLHRTTHELSARMRWGVGNKTIFVRLHQGPFLWWQPICLRVIEPVEIVPIAEIREEGRNVRVISHLTRPLTGLLIVNNLAQIGRGRQWSRDALIPVQTQVLRPGTNTFYFENEQGVLGKAQLVDWQIPAPKDARYEKIDLSALFNDRITNIFKNKYVSPRPAVPTLQLPEQGIGNWCYPLVTVEIVDSGLRSVAGERNEITLPQGVPLARPGVYQTGESPKKEQPGARSGMEKINNIVFTSRWNNYPDSVTVPLWGSATHAYFLMAGSTDPMQSHITNGVIEFWYKNGMVDSLPLINPSTWWPIEQDYYEDGFAFTTGAPRPLRVSLQIGRVTGGQYEHGTIKGFTNMAVPGGAATVLDMPLKRDVELDRMVLRTEAEDVVIGLISLTLLRN